jgi:hypothetical protein
MRRLMIPTHWQSSPGWQSSIYNFQDYSAQELKDLWISDLNMTFGAACSALRKSWSAFKLNRDRGDEARTLYYSQVINKLQSGLGIEETIWDL